MFRYQKSLYKLTFEVLLDMIAKGWQLSSPLAHKLLKFYLTYKHPNKWLTIKQC